MTPDDVAVNYFKHLQRGQNLLDIGRGREALYEFNQHLIAFPSDYTALCQSAVCYIQLKEFQTAYDTTKTAIEGDPEGEWAYRLQSVIFSQNGEHKRALDAARICIEKAPSLSVVQSRLFWAQAEFGDLDNAETTLKLLLRSTPDDSESREAAAYLAMKRENFPEAERLYLDALKLNPESVQALNNLGVIYLKYVQTGKGHHYKGKAVDMFERAVKIQPTFKLGQRNISAASTAIRTGAPIGLFLGLWIAIQVFGRVIGDEPGALVKAVESSLAQPNSTSMLVIFTEILSAMIVIAMALIALVSIKPAYRERITYEMGTVKVWLVSSLIFATVSAMYLVGFCVFDQPVSLFAGVSTLLFLSLGMASIVNLVFCLFRLRSQGSKSQI